MDGKIESIFHTFIHWDCDKMATIFKFIISYEACFILIQISLTFVAKGPIDNKPALV